MAARGAAVTVEEKNTVGYLFNDITLDLLQNYRMFPNIESVKKFSLFATSGASET